MVQEPTIGSDKSLGWGRSIGRIRSLGGDREIGGAGTWGSSREGLSLRGRNMEGLKEGVGKKIKPGAWVWEHGRGQLDRRLGGEGPGRLLGPGGSSTGASDWYE